MREHIERLLKKADFWFFVLIILMCFLYNYPDIFLLEPQSAHVWRQTDCSSLALNYYQNGMNFFEPEIHFQASDYKNSGYCVGEFPIIYYIVAGLYQIFGPHDYIFRGFNFFIFLSGLFALYRLLSELFRHRFWAIGITALLFTSPVVVFYANNFLSNVPALALVFWAWFFVFRYIKQKQILYLLLGFLFFTIAGLLKITSTISFIPLGGILLAEFLGLHKKWQLKSFFHHRWLTLFCFLFSAFIIQSWYSYAIAYNGMHSSIYFSTRTWPLWDLSDTEVEQIVNNVKWIWVKEYFHSSVLWLNAVILFFILWKVKQVKVFYSYMIYSMLIGVLCYGLLWFLAFGYHDYYIIEVLVPFLFILIAFMDYMRRYHYRWFNSFLLKIVFMVFLVNNINYAKKQTKARYNGWMNYMGNVTALSGMEPFLEELGIDRSAKVISVPDSTPNHSLYLINRKGWTDLYDWTKSEAGIRELIAKGGRYLIVNDAGILADRPYMELFTKDKIAEKNGVHIYRLTPEDISE